MFEEVLGLEKNDYIYAYYLGSSIIKYCDTRSIKARHLKQVEAAKKINEQVEKAKRDADEIKK